MCWYCVCVFLSVHKARHRAERRGMVRGREGQGITMKWGPRESTEEFLEGEGITWSKVVMRSSTLVLQKS